MFVTGDGELMLETWEKSRPGIYAEERREGEEELFCPVLNSVLSTRQSITDRSYRNISQSGTDVMFSSGRECDQWD
ncbi:hypothetical protein FGB62_162g010 [Gracilaria domingensis]|nr:hypothetical protein FGB62_162g010 [Gracilaria domingensis]